MLNKLIQRLLGNNTEHELKKMWPIVRRINDLEPKLAGLSDSSLQEKTFEFKIVWLPVKRWMISCPKPLPSFVKHPVG